MMLHNEDRHVSLFSWVVMYAHTPIYTFSRVFSGRKIDA